MSRGRYLRRIQKIKTGSFMVSLPMDWVKRNNLSSQSPVFVIEDPNNNVVVRIPTSKCLVEVNVSQLSISVLEDVLKILYMQGLSKIILKSETGFSEEVVRLVRSLRQDLIGYEVEDIGFKQIIIEVKDSIEYVDSETFMRYFKKSLRYLKSALASLPSHVQSYNAKNVKEVLLEAKRTYRYLARLLALALKEPERNGLPASLHVVYIENITRLREIAYYIYRMVDFVESLTPKDVELLKPMISVVSRAIDLLENGLDIDALASLREEVNSSEEALIAQTHNPKLIHSAFALRRIMHNLLRIVENFYAVAKVQDVKCVAEELEKTVEFSG
ncbi:Phosphate uptake regulator [Pyrobaculum oguniense TE7]|uniref:Phosphate uptake regulator n=1 Tax=Pyrobaculum oguniense (strain DSM 13380 / JCM 10595 / TE7) TaxID=698757 RepID=H6Q9F6_PYROT|nr:Phosphate uptake regulator [Pyrobaculum oguniense TE7]